MSDDWDWLYEDDDDPLPPSKPKAKPKPAPTLEQLSADAAATRTAYKEARSANARTMLLGTAAERDRAQARIDEAMRASIEAHARAAQSGPTTDEGRRLKAAFEAKRG